MIVLNKKQVIRKYKSPQFSYCKTQLGFNNHNALVISSNMSYRNGKYRNEKIYACLKNKLLLRLHILKFTYNEIT